MSALEIAGIKVWRTDDSGDLAVVVDAGQVSVVTRDFSPD